MRVRVTKVKPNYLLGLSETTRGMIFIHASESPALNMAAIQKGDRLDAEVVDTERGPRGVNAVFLDGAADLDTEIDAIVRKVSFTGFLGFAAPVEGGADCFFHVTGFMDYEGGTSAMFNGLALGDRVHGVRRMTPRGPRLERVYLVEQVGVA